MKTPEIRINGRPIGVNYSPYVIAEMSANHNGSLDLALRIIEAAANSGADAVKLQTYTADTITLDSDSEEFRIHGGLWDGKTLYQLYDEAHMPWDWHKPLFERAQEVGITIFSTPIDNSAVDLLEDFNAPAYKIASFEAIDLPLIKYAASTGKPLIISTGMADENEIQEAISAAREAGCNEVALLHCVSGYPAPAEDYNLRTIPDMIRRYGAVTGLSDHTLDNITAIASISLGSAIIEKHFALNRSDGGPDSSFSLEPTELRALCHSVRNAWMALGKIDYSVKSSEANNVKFRRSLYITKNLRAGDIITMDNIRSIRPGYGLPPKQLFSSIGRRLLQDAKRGDPLTEDMLE